LRLSSPPSGQGSGVLTDDLEREISRRFGKLVE
jgi:hypothetical protein